MMSLSDAVLQEVEDRICEDIARAITYFASRAVGVDVLKLATKLSIITMNNLGSSEITLSESLNLLDLSVAKALIAASFYQYTTAELIEALEVVQEKEVQNALQDIYLSWYA